MATQLYLASASPRRIELLGQMGIKCTVSPANVDEHAEGEPESVVRELARRKAAHVAAQHGQGLVLAADTIVYAEGRKLGKPRDMEDALRMLRLLSGKWHRVYTGVCLVDCRTGRTLDFADCARVHMQDLTQEEMRAYVSSGEPMDKAGAYGIQGLGGCLVDAIEGDFYTVMGLPLARTRLLLKEMGVNVL